MRPLLTAKEAARLLHSPKGEVALSLDLGKSKTRVIVREDTIHFPDGSTLPIEAIKKLKDNTIYFVEDNELRQVALFSEDTNFHYKLRPTADWPTVTLSSTPMHRHTNISPRHHAKLMIAEIAPVQGAVLDTCCGLGYTAILAAERADKVKTFDDDPNVAIVARYNPYSEELFTNKKIDFVQGDVFENIKNLKDDSFDRILHDPPTLKYAPVLFSSAFHRELFRVLKKGGILYHYCPTPKKTHGDLLYPRIMRQLKESGFSDVEYHEKSSGIRAVK